MANDTAVPAPRRVIARGQNAPLNRPLRSRRASAGSQWALVGVCKTRIERVGHSRGWVASRCAVRRTWRSGLIGYHYESPDPAPSADRAARREHCGHGHDDRGFGVSCGVEEMSYMAGDKLGPYEIRSSGALAEGYYCLIPDCPPHLDFSAVGDFTDNDVTLRVNCNTVRVCQITTLVTRPPEF